MKVVGQGKVHANILRKDASGQLETQVAGFTKLTSSNQNDLYGAYVAVSESITAYVRYEYFVLIIHLLFWMNWFRLQEGESLHLGMGRDRSDNNIAAVKSGLPQSVHFTVQRLAWK